MFKRRRIGEFLSALDRIPVPKQDLARLEELVLAEITSLWQTDEVRSHQPTVYDEIKMGAGLLRRLDLCHGAGALQGDCRSSCAPHTGWNWRHMSCHWC